MARFSYYMFDGAARLVRAEAGEHEDILDAFERMRMLLDELTAIEMVQLWQDEDFVGHIKRGDGRLILKTKTDPLPTHPLYAARRPATKAS
jgi:hypothetical protein